MLLITAKHQLVLWVASPKRTHCIHKPRGIKATLCYRPFQDDHARGNFCSSSRFQWSNHPTITLVHSILSEAFICPISSLLGGSCTHSGSHTYRDSRRSCSFHLSPIMMKRPVGRDLHTPRTMTAQQVEVWRGYCIRLQPRLKHAETFFMFTVWSKYLPPVPGVSSLLIDFHHVDWVVCIDNIVDPVVWCTVK